MAQVINSNIASLNAQRNLNANQSALSTSLERLSSGLRINSAKDDAAGLAISERFTSQIRGMNQAARNANDGISLAQTAEGALSVVSNNLQRIRELSVQSANATNSATDRAALQAEVAQLKSEIDRVATTTQFNGVNLLDGTFTQQQFQVGANANQTITLSSLASAKTNDLGTSYLATSTGSAVSNAAFVAGDISINGVSVGASVAGTGNGQAADSAWAKAIAINATSGTGVTAVANATSATGADMSGGSTAGNAGTITINGVNTSTITATATESTNRAAVVAAINAISAATGVIAADSGADGTGVTLSAADGRNIAVTLNGTLTGADAGVATATTRSTLTLTSTSSSGITMGGASAAKAGSISSAAASLTGNAVATLDISTVSGANAAITSVDAALQAINSSRAQLGAYQSRFNSAISNLQSTSENMSAARSRIQDADFAAETSMLTRAQILQQAGTAMLAQANSLPQSVLSLLRG